MLVAYREYTTDGRFITNQEFGSVEDVFRDDVEGLTDPDINEQVEAQYHRVGVLSQEEMLKLPTLLNISVRGRDGRFVKYKHLL
ncbi:hypothetical protein [Herbiconiux daphne]|uniref:Uncharacterized protein n=1 Tax=Herbiconiux daphne TaxID=2970914 RepID=A0ABT2HCA9_9MICO|nr:hypothetical protein [Herbiconiux daphne]MCS5737586.1 hypothetical protein [Herbiconiux daphne]